MHASLVAWLRLGIIVFLALLIPVTWGVGAVSPRDVTALAAIAALISGGGQTLAAWLRLPRLPGFIVAAEIVLGAVATALVVLATVAAGNVRAPWAMIAWLGLTAIAVRWAQPSQRDARGEPEEVPRDFFVRDAAIVILIAVLVTIASRETLSAYRVARETFHFSPWRDYFAHASETNYLNHYPSFGAKSLYLSGMDQYFYHRGSYVFSAAFAGLSGRTAVQSATCFWLPLGLWLLGLGAWALGSALRGRVVGAIAVFGLFALPDAAAYGIRNGFFSYHWLINIAPGAAYGIGAILLALAFAVVALRQNRSSRLIWTGAALAALSAFFKVQTMLPAAVFFGVVVLVRWKPAHPRIRIATIAAGVLGAAGLALWLERLPLAPHFLSGRNEAVRLLDVVVTFGPTALAEWVNQATTSQSAFAHGVTGVTVLFLSAFGLLLPASIVLALAKGKDPQPPMVRWTPLLLLGGYAVVIFGVPTGGYGDIGEFVHRPFVVIYPVMLVMVVTELGGIVRRARLAEMVGRVPWRMVGALGLTTAFALTWAGGTRLHRSTLRWANNFVDQPIPADLFAVAGYLQDHAARADSVWSSDRDPTGRTAALTERPSFLAYPDTFAGLPATRDVAKQRLELHAQVSQLTTREQLAAICRANQVRWLVLFPGDFPAWPAELRDRCDEKFGEIRLYRF